MRPRVTYTRLLVTAFASFAAVSMVAGCPGVPESAVSWCDPNALFPAPGCVDAGTNGDAGTDDEADAAPDADPDAQGTCPGVCVRGPSGDWGALWSEEPLLVWIGPASEMPASCLDGASDPQDVKFRLFSGLVAPPATCDTCECEPSTGTCELLPETIEVRTGTCAESGVSSLPFGGPAGWDGSCSSDHALPAGAQCPAGSGEFCAQSVRASALPGPTSESCEVKVLEVPKFTVETNWTTAALACGANAPAGRCGDDRLYCARSLPLPWNICTWRAGIHLCPENFDYAPPIVMYGKMPTDNRSCTKCECGAPQGSGCLATLNLHDDAACTVEYTPLPLSSFVEQCHNVQPPGRVLGSKSMTDLAYMPGTCLASGGDPIGEAQPNTDTAVTFCCIPPFAG